VGQQRQNTGRRIDGPCTSDGARHRVRRTELTRTDVGDELTVICQVRRCQAVYTLVDQDSDLEQ